MANATPVTKKVVLLIVEGPTEETALGSVFQRLFSDSLVKFDVVHGDMTVSQTSKEPRDRVRELILGELKRDRGYQWKDIAQIVQICDTDGAFIPDDLVLAGEADAIEYREDRILTSKTESIRLRNRRKRESLRKLSDISCLTYQKHEVPYRIYYFSRNMEHALHNRSDSLSNSEKSKLAQSFRRRFSNDLPQFKAFMRSPEVAVPGDYQTTWSVLQEGVSSLRRGSNLHLAIPE
ncbi:hypothetical protein [Bifidobacterium eulemuris]|uniref:Uncharacterized protein n=1 Tax=Bifidobacterium eulemuris TaxID=1765219 RepID=A0A261GAW2_9BIFI|nr:hypothetical protein [Bifidobacterium eulemuris]OZG68558.1 hypothetical protein BEUL_0868 [Bifidobacterium eulemuris]QOL32687.1 hypothetical protein BE0216_09745 [Bifidobacterium eulemuris]